MELHTPSRLSSAQAAGIRLRDDFAQGACGEMPRLR
jgi:hypothetical protein